jgi:hypothetical protein
MALAAAALAGCGGSKAPSGADGAAVRMPEIGKVPAGVLLREQQPRFSPEVVMLGAREATEIWIPVAPLSEIDADLAKIRQTYPALAKFKPSISATDILFVTLKPDVAFADAWEAGRLETGEAELDAVLRHFNAVSVSRSFGKTFAVQFAQSLNLEQLGPVVQATSTAVKLANGDFFMGEVPEILRSKAADARVYTFIDGCDSPAGCTDRHTWVLRFAPDGALTMSETTT